MPTSTGLGTDLAADRFGTAGEIINRAAAEVGLGELAEPYTSSDPNFAQLRRMLQSAGDDLADQHPWAHFIRECSFSTVLGQTVYILPDDFGSMVDQTGWNRTSRWPLAGPLTSQEWQYLASRVVSSLRVAFRATTLQFELLTAPPAGTNIRFEYRSKCWVQSKGASAPDSVKPTSKDDVVLLDEYLMVCALKLRFLRAKGFDTASAQREFEDALDTVKGTDAPARTLTFGGDRGAVRLLGAANLPDTGYGT